VADWKGSEPMTSATKPFHLGPGIRRDERIEEKASAESGGGASGAVGDDGDTHSPHGRGRRAEALP